MAKGKVISDKERIIIAQVYMEHLSWNAKQVQAEVNKQLGNMMDKGKVWPGLSAVQKVMTNVNKNLIVRKKNTSLSVLEQSWSVSTISRYPISPEGLPVVLKIWMMLIDGGLTDPLTIRMAQWIDRLHFTTQDLNLLLGHAFIYSRNDEDSELIGISPSSTFLDIGLYETMTKEKVFGDDTRIENITKMLGKPDKLIEMTHNRMKNPIVRSE
jgi:hypothetical protein